MGSPTTGADGVREMESAHVRAVGTTSFRPTDAERDGLSLKRAGSIADTDILAIVKKLAEARAAQSAADQAVGTAAAAAREAKYQTARLEELFNHVSYLIARPAGSDPESEARVACEMKRLLV